MVLGEADRRFLAYRRERSRFGLWALPAAFVGLVGAWVGIWAYLPLAVNPWKVIGLNETHGFEPGELTMYAIGLTVLVNVLFVLLCTFVVFAALWARRERRYLRIASAAAVESSDVAARNHVVPPAPIDERQ